jgi:hypothetical protein
MNGDPLPTAARLENRRSVLEVIPEALHNSNQESACLSQATRSQASDQGLRQAAGAWTAVDHGKGMRHCNHTLEKKILVKRGQRE